MSRLEPENQADLVIRAYADVPGDVPLLIVGDAPYATEYKAELARLAAADPRVRLIGGMYGEAYTDLQRAAMAYIQATSVGGTHPALIESMAAGNLVLAFGTPENREVTAGTALLFDDQAQLTDALTRVVQAPDSPEHQALRAAARARAGVDLLVARHRRPVRGALRAAARASLTCPAPRLRARYSACTASTPPSAGPASPSATISRRSIAWTRSVEAARGVVCLHATDPATVYLSTWARLREPSLEAVERELYEERRLVRMLAMRRTLFVVPTDEAPVLQAAASLDVARTERRRNEQLVAMLGEDDPAGWLRAGGGGHLGRPGRARRGHRRRSSPGRCRRWPARCASTSARRYEGDIGISSRVLIVLALEGRIVRGRPRGTWISSQYRWASMERWLGSAAGGPGRRRLRRPDSWPAGSTASAPGRRPTSAGGPA